MSEQTEQATEAAIKAAGAVAPRVRPEDLDAEIAKGSVHYFTALDGVLGEQLRTSPTGHVGGIDNHKSLEIITICVIVLASGFKLIGHSAPVSAENFREDIGRNVAFRNAREQLWSLLGFRLADRLHVAETLGVDPNTSLIVGTVKEVQPVIKGIIGPGPLPDAEGYGTITVNSQEAKP